LSDTDTSQPGSTSNDTDTNPSDRDTNPSDRDTNPSDRDTGQPTGNRDADVRPARGRRGRRGGRGRGSGASDRGQSPDTAPAEGGDAAPESAPEASTDPPTASEDVAAGSGDAPGGTGEDGGARRRRRRGRRGRGRGKGPDDQAADVDTTETEPGSDETAATTAPPSVEATGDAGAGTTDGGDTGSQGGRSRATRSGDGGSKGGGSKGGGAKSGGSKGSKGGGSKGNGSKGSGSRGGGSKGGSKADDAGSGSATSGAGDGAGASETDGDGVEAEIARGGTRMAAKRGNRRGGGGGGNRRGQQRPGGVPEEVRRAILEGPPRTMLVTAREDRTQIAVMEDRSVVEHYVTRKDEVTYVGNIYMARVQNVLPGMEAAFLDIGKGRNGVLYAGEVLFDELDLEEGADQRIENVLKPGQKVLVQVTKDPMGTKGPRLTMHLSLAGRYVVLAPDSDLFGISRKLTDKERDRLRRIVKQVKPEHHGVIVRTAAEGATEEQITADMERLLAKWAKVEKAAEGAKALTAVYEEPSLVVKVIRDNFGPEFERCIVDEEDLYHQVRGYLDEVAEELLPKVELYGAPTRDARARAAGAPAAEGADAITHELATGAVPTGEGSPNGSGPTAATNATDAADANDAPDAPDANDAPDAPEASDTNDAGTGPATDVPSPDEPVTGDGGPPAPTGSEDEAHAGSPDPTQPQGVGTVDLAAAAARRESLPPLFEAYDVADQLRKAMGRKIWLPSGGYLIIETTEAMKVIDVNTGKFTGGKDTNLEEVVLKTNLEAADEIVRQLRLRDMGGIIIIDFIDMLLKANQDQVVRRLKRELLRDRTKTRVSEVSRLGLVQMTRKNVSQGLIESFSHMCEACEGRGIIGELD
jgi:Ribonuclease G/E